MKLMTRPAYEKVVDEISQLDWSGLTQDDLVDVAWAYYHFSVQFRENLQIACQLYPQDKLKQLEQEECDTSNLSSWPGVAAAGEKMNHDEFMRRLLQLSPISEERRSNLERVGQSYLAEIREIDPTTRALSITSYEDGGLEKVFGAFLEARDWNGPLLQAFRHFVTEHIKFDSDPEQGHGALSRELAPDDRIMPLWIAFRDLLVQSVPKLAA